SGWTPASTSARRSASAKVRSTMRIGCVSLVAGERSGPAPEAPQVAADDLERYAGTPVRDMDRHHADPAGAQRVEQRREPGALERFGAARPCRGIACRERRAQRIEHDEVPAVLRQALQPGGAGFGQLARAELR